jgi:hypothetical protein
MKSGKLTLIIVVVFVLVNGAAAAIYLATKTPDTDTDARVLALAEEAKTEGVRAMQAGRYDDAARALERAIALGDGSDSTRELLASVNAERTRAASPPIALADTPMTEPVPPEAPEPSMRELEAEEPEIRERELEQSEDGDPEMGRAPTARERRLYELRRARERAQEEEEEEPEPPPQPVEPEPEPVAEPPPQPPPTMVEPPPQPVRTTPMTEPVRPSMSPEPIPEPTGTDVGELEILSRVDGEVYVNGRRYGTAPRIVRHVPAGRARVEIREGGRVVSSTTVTVRARERRSVLLR